MSQLFADHSAPVLPVTIKNASARQGGPRQGGPRRGGLWYGFVCAGLAVALSACSSAPPPVTSAPGKDQQKVQSAQDWDVVAGNVEREVALWLRLSNWENNPLSVDSGNDSTFSRGFKSLLTARFLNDGFTVSTDPQSTVRVQYDVQVITGKARPQTAKADPADLPDGEIIISVSIHNGNTVAFKKNFIFFVNGKDVDQYSGGASESMFTIVGSATDPKAKPTAWKAADQRCAQRGNNKAMLRSVTPLDATQQEFRFDCVGR